MNETPIDRLSNLTTPHLADGCLRTNLPIRCAPAGLRPLVGNMRCAGRARPVRHVGSIDIFFESLQGAAPGEVLVIDNGGRLDEACIGDIVALEAKAEGMAGIVIWGLHRDSQELSEIGFPVFSLGALPTGPQRLDARPADIVCRATVGAHVVTSGDFVVADANGVLFLPEDRLDDIIAAAVAARETEGRQLRAMRTGRSYRSQVRFSEYLSRRERDAGYGFRQHLKDIEAAGEA
ncbi:MAG: RraA family protein [Proteobacteria bacterium]|nr:RraA family protein [Pseudomonadota bacterium]